MDQKQKDQQKFLLSELGRVRTYAHDEIPDPPAVKRARVLIERYDKKCGTVRDRFRKRAQETCAKIRKEIYFGSYTRALKMIEAALKEFGSDR